MRKSQLIKKHNNQIYFKIFIALLWAESILLNYIRGVMVNLPLISGVADYVIPCVIFVSFMMASKTITGRLRGSDFVFIMSCIVVFAFEYWVYAKNRAYFRMLYMEFITGCLPFYFVGVALRGDDKDVLDWLYRISAVTIVTFSIYMLFVNSMEGLTLSGGDMASAYNILPHSCLAFYYVMKKFKWHRLILFVVSAIAILMMGSRGPVLCLGVFVIVVSVLTIRLNKPYVLIGIIVLSAVFVLIPDLLDRLMESGYALGERYGLSTRIFDKITSGNFTVSSGRNVIRQKIRYHLRQVPVVGLGIYGDRYVTEGYYAHNFFLEVYAHFGYLLGTIICVSFTLFVVRGLAYAFQAKDESAQGIALVLLCCCIKLMVSSSYLRDLFLWLLIGYVAGLLRENRTTHVLGTKRKSQVRKKSKFVK